MCALPWQKAIRKQHMFLLLDYVHKVFPFFLCCICYAYRCNGYISGMHPVDSGGGKTLLLTHLLVCCRSSRQTK